MTEHRACLSKNVWGGWDRDTMTFIGTCLTEYAEDAARRICAENWASGTHRIFVGNGVEGHEFRITLEAEEVK